MFKDNKNFLLLNVCLYWNKDFLSSGGKADDLDKILTIIINYSYSHILYLLLFVKQIGTALWVGLGKHEA